MSHCSKYTQNACSQHSLDKGNYCSNHLSKILISECDIGNLNNFLNKNFDCIIYKLSEYNNNFADKIYKSLEYCLNKYKKDTEISTKINNIILKAEEQKHLCTCNK
jgi:hypothetical protein